MRIIGGSKRGMRLHTPTGTTTRPTMDRARETILNIALNTTDFRPHIVGGHVADVFAGSGAMGLEMISRGASHCVFYENNHSALKILQKNINRFGTQACTVQHNALTPCPTETPFDCVFMDAPYTDNTRTKNTLGKRAIEAFIKQGLIHLKTLIIIQLNTRPPTLNGFIIEKDRKIGGGHVYFYKASV